MSRNLDRKKPGGRLSGRVDSLTLPCVTIAMMWHMMFYEHMALLSYSIRHKSTSPTNGMMLYLAAATRSLNTRLSRCACLRCRSANWRYYAIIVTADGHDLNELLVSNGLARIYGTRTPLPDSGDSQTYLAHLPRVGEQSEDSEARCMGQSAPMREVRSYHFVIAVWRAQR